MKNLKKVLALVMVCAMFFTVSSFAFTDVEEDASYLEAVTLLSKLGIINGYEDGTFLPDNTITRAEIAKVLVCALNATEQAEGAKADNIFTDVPASHWAAGYVNYAANMGIINGRGNGIYDPEAPVTYEEAVKLIVAMLGYTPVANVKGGYPTGYLYAANQVMKITKGATGTSGDAAKRWVVARLIYNALECRIMEQETWSAADPEYIKGSDTLLEDYLDITKLEGIVTNTFMLDFEDKDDQDIAIDLKKVGNTALTDEEDAADDAEFKANGTGAEDYLGYYVVAYVKAYGEGEEELVAVAPKAGKNKTLTVALGDFDADLEEAEEDYFVFDYFVDDDNTKTAKADREIAFYENGVLNSTPDALYNDIKSDMSDPDDPDYGYGEGYADADGVITFLSNDGNSTYEYAFLEKVSNEVVVDEINDRRFKVTSKTDADDETLDPEDETSYVTFYKDGKVASFDDIAEGDVLSIVTGWSGGNVKKVYISSNKVEGYISATSNGAYKIDGNFYEQSSFSIADGLTLGRRDSGIFYINANGRIAYVEKEAEVGGNYGFLLAVNTNESFSSGVDYTLRFMNTKGEWIDADLADTISVTAYDDVESKMVTTKITDLEENIADIYTASNEWLEVVDGELTMNDALTNRVFQYTLNSNGELAKIVVADDAITEDNFSYERLVEEDEDEDGVYTGSVYDALKNRFKAQENSNVGVDKNTVVFKVDLKDDQNITGARVSDEEGNPSSLKKSQITVVDYTLFADGEDYKGFVYDLAGDAYKCMVITNASTSIAKDAKLLVVSDVEIVSNDEEEEYIIIEGYMDGEKVTLETGADAALESAVEVTGLGDIEDIEAYVDGAIFEVALDGEGKITNINILFDGKSEFAAGVPADDLKTIDADDEELIYYFGAIATKKLTSSSSKYIELVKFAAGEDTMEEVSTAGSFMKGNIYNVDLTGRKAKYDVADSISAFLNSVDLDADGKVTVDAMRDTDVVNFAFVKEYDGEVIDIVVYSVEYEALAE